MKKKVRSFFALLAVCGMLSLGSNNVQSADFWLGAGYLASANGASAEAGGLIGLTGLAHSTLWGAALGGPTGAAVGFGYGL